MQMCFTNDGVFEMNDKFEKKKSDNSILCSKLMLSLIIYYQV